MKTPNKYFLYENAVQDARSEIGILASLYRRVNEGEDARLFREDFCGTFSNSCEWVKRHRDNKAMGIDLDPEPLAYGRENHLAKLKQEQQGRVTLLNKNVLAVKKPKVDIIAACNFSYYIFKERDQFVHYCRSSYDSLRHQGTLIMDSFGGTEMTEPNLDETKMKASDKTRFTYFWDQDTFNAITNEAKFYIHFEVPQGKGKKPKKMRRAFTYDWRLWAIQETRDVLKDAGFEHTYVYWEGTDDDGDGNGHFSRTEKEEICDTWIAYIVGHKA